MPQPPENPKPPENPRLTPGAVAPSARLVRSGAPCAHRELAQASPVPYLTDPEGGR